MGASSRVGHDVREQVPDGVERAETQMDEEPAGDGASSAKDDAKAEAAGARFVRILDRCNR